MKRRHDSHVAGFQLRRHLLHRALLALQIQRWSVRSTPCCSLGLRQSGLRQSCQQNGTGMHYIQSSCMPMAASAPSHSNRNHYGACNLKFLQILALLAEQHKTRHSALQRLYCKDSPAARGYDM